MIDTTQLDPARPIVILAVQRSGSTLLKTLLSSHPSIFIAASSDLLWELVDEDLSIDALAGMARYEEEHEETFRSFEHVHSFVQQTVMSFWMTSGEPEALGKRAVSHWGFVFYELDTSSLPKLYDVFPQGKFLHIVRDGRDVVASWLANYDDLAAGRPDVKRDPVRLARMWAQHLKVAAAYPAHLLRLEDLSDANKRAATIEAMLSYLEAPSAPELEAFCAELPWVNAQKQTHQRWRQDLNEAQLEAMYRQHAFKSMLIEHGYLVD